VTITPDTKDWTWVVQRRCEQCGFDPAAVDRETLPERMRDCAARWPGLLLRHDDPARRPDPGTWSPLEYAAHVRDVAGVMHERLGLILGGDDPTFPDWDQDRAAVDGRYGELDPATVLGQLALGWEQLAAAYDAVPDDAWELTGRRGDGASFTAYTLGLYALHDLEHHAQDVAPPRPRPLDVTEAELLRRRSLKWRAFPEDTLPLWVAEMDAHLAEPVRRTLLHAARTGDTGYPPGTGYAEAWADFAARRWGWDGLAVERTRVVPDVMQGAMHLVAAVTDPGDAVVVSPPVYPPFYSFTANAGRRVVEAPMGADGRLDLDCLDRVFGEVTRGGRRAAYLLCSPHNPLGTVHTAEELTAVAELSERHGVRVVVDEIHAPLVLPGARFVPYLSVPGSERGFALLSASKGWNLAGLKAAVAVAGEAAAEELEALPVEIGHGATHLGLMTQTAALRHGEAWLDELLEQLDANREFLGARLPELLPGVTWQPPEGTYLAWLDCRALGLDDGVAARPGDQRTYLGSAKAFLDGGVALSPGTAFGPGGEGRVRLNFATSQEILGRALERMARAVTR
jgi:cystathionine beta-lyase